jgi:hypothetical protein
MPLLRILKAPAGALETSTDIDQFTEGLVAVFNEPASRPAFFQIHYSHVELIFDAVEGEVVPPSVNEP